MKRSVELAACLFILPALAAPFCARAAIPAYVIAAVESPGRPDADKARDADRKPAEIVTFSGMKPGWKVADIIPGTGYYDRIFAGVVGSKGHVYAFYPTEILNFRKEVQLPLDGTTPFLSEANITALVKPVNQFAAPEALDLVWISDNYHDLHDPFFAPADLGQINRAVFKALKPGGVYLVVDHAAASGSGLQDTNTLHRIDRATVVAEVEAAGFKLVSESAALHNAADTHALRIFDPAIRSHTDQFVLLFRKPA
jgi:predicted methyltransferase